MIALICVSLLAGCGGGSGAQESIAMETAQERAVRAAVDKTPVCTKPVRLPYTIVMRQLDDGEAAGQLGEGYDRAVEALADVHLLSRRLVRESHGDGWTDSTYVYTVSRYGRRFLQQTTAGSRFCYGRQRYWVSAWTNAWDSTDATIWWLYQIDGLAPWVQSPELQHAMPDVKFALTGEGRVEHMTAVHLLPNGRWVASGPFDFSPMHYGGFESPSPMHDADFAGAHAPSDAW